MTIFDADEYYFILLINVVLNTVSQCLMHRDELDFDPFIADYHYAVVLPEPDGSNASVISLREPITDFN